MWKRASHSVHQSFGRYSRLRRKAPTVAFAMATFISIRPASTYMQAAKTKDGHRNSNTCETYGCPLLPQDVYYDTKTKEALTSLRALKRDQVDENQNSYEQLEPSGNKHMATLTLIGYKGGPVETQINQDRSFCVSPFYFDAVTKNLQKPDNRLLGVFDGHADLGEQVSEFVVTELPKLLASKLKAIQHLPEKVARALNETFVEMDKKAPAEKSGGCTASIVLQLGPKVYFANAGDSRSFLVVYRKESQTVEIVYITREDKPHLEDERARVEKMGGEVYIPMMGGTSRVLYIDPVTGMQSGLAMSRSIGDWEVGKLGVIPDPLVDVIDIPELVGAQMKANGSATDDIHVFAVSATDGMMDYATPEIIAQTVAISLYADDGPHLLTALEQLIYMAAQGWERSKQGRYRDDIAVAVSQIRIPPPPPAQ